MVVKAKRVVWAPRAKRDLREVWRYYARVASPDIADRLLRDIGRAGETLAEHSLLWRARDDVLPGLRSITIAPYILFYRVTETRVDVARVLHERRDLAAAFKAKET